MGRDQSQVLVTGTGPITRVVKSDIYSQKEIGLRRGLLHQTSVPNFLGPAFCKFSLVGLTDLGDVAVTGCSYPEREEEVTASGVVL